MYLELGAAMSAYELLVNVQMWEDAIECLMIAGNKN